ncbi:hypothetical protein F5B20DRAFT_172240 [Whalleya microplaca]|nr:hypothetical protein F5B20DRAFT_172240 [Whalleya microplaca]
MAPLIPTLTAHARNLFFSARSTVSDLAGQSPSIPTTSSLAQHLGPLAARSILVARDGDTSKDDTSKVDPHKGVVRPNDINNTFVFVLFGLIGAAFVCTGIWFFFWARNGGFHFKQNDWEDYKSTVLRRKGPNGTVLSGATESTDLGGGSVYKDVDDRNTEYTGGLTQMTGRTGRTDDTQSTLTGITGGVSDFAGRERRRQRRERKEREKEKKKDRKNRSKSAGRRVGEDGVLVDEEAEAEAKARLRAYRHEKPARVGGINKASEGSEWDGSTNPDNSTSAGSDLLSNRQSTPTSTPTKKKDNSNDNSYSEAGTSTVASSAAAEKDSKDKDKDKKKKSGGGIRKVYSTADRTSNRENERIRAEARRLQEKGRAAGAGRRDFSYQRAEHSYSSPRHHDTIQEETASAAGDNAAGNNNRYLPPPMSEAGTSDIGTKSYHHVIPGLSSTAASSSVVSSGYTEEKRKKRGSTRRYRRGEE